MVCCWLPRL